MYNVITLDEVQKLLSEKGFKHCIKNGGDWHYEKTKTLIVHFYDLPIDEKLKGNKKYTEPVLKLFFTPIISYINNVYITHEEREDAMQEIIDANPGVTKDSYIWHSAYVYDRATVKDDEFIECILKTKRKTPFGAGGLDLDIGNNLPYEHECTFSFLQKQRWFTKFNKRIETILKIVTERNTLMQDEKILSYADKVRELRDIAKAAKKDADDAKQKFMKIIKQRQAILNDELEIKIT